MFELHAARMCAGWCVPKWEGLVFPLEAPEMQTKVISYSGEKARKRFYFIGNML